MYADSPVESRNGVNQLFQMILSNSFPRLRICTAIGIEALNSNETWTGAPAIRLLLLSGQTPLINERLRSACPNLRLLKSSSDAHPSETTHQESTTC